MVLTKNVQQQVKQTGCKLYFRISLYFLMLILQFTNAKVPKPSTSETNLLIDRNTSNCCWSLSL